MPQSDANSHGFMQVCPASRTPGVNVLFSLFSDKRPRQRRAWCLAATATDQRHHLRHGMSVVVAAGRITPLGSAATAVASMRGDSCARLRDKPYSASTLQASGSTVLTPPGTGRESWRNDT